MVQALAYISQINSATFLSIESLPGSINRMRIFFHCVPDIAPATHRISVFYSVLIFILFSSQSNILHRPVNKFYTNANCTSILLWPESYEFRFNRTWINADRKSNNKMLMKTFVCSSVNEINVFPSESGTVICSENNNKKKQKSKHRMVDSGHWIHLYSFRCVTSINEPREKQKKNATKY